MTSKFCFLCLVSLVFPHHLTINHFTYSRLLILRWSGKKTWTRGLRALRIFYSSRKSNFFRWNGWWNRRIKLQRVSKTLVWQTKYLKRVKVEAKSMRCRPSHNVLFLVKQESGVDDSGTYQLPTLCLVRAAGRAWLPPHSPPRALLTTPLPTLICILPFPDSRPYLFPPTPGLVPHKALFLLCFIVSDYACLSVCLSSFWSDEVQFCDDIYNNESGVIDNHTRK